MRKVKKCIFAGSFDPLTNGHMYMVEKGSQIFDQLVVALGTNPDKKYVFSTEQRLDMLKRCTRQFSNVSIEHFKGQFLVNYAQDIGAGYILRGLRNARDFEYERSMRNVNGDINQNMDTIFLVPPREVCDISSSFLKGLIGLEGWEKALKPYLPEPVWKMIAHEILESPD